MKKISLVILLLIVSLLKVNAQALQEDASVTIKKIYDNALNQGKCYGWLRELSVDVGKRLSGSVGAEKAVLWAEKSMKEAGFDKVFLQEVMVPKWERGAPEQCFLLKKGNKPHSLRLAALGGSVATPKEGLSAKIIEVDGLESFEKIPASQVKGKIVFFNRKMNPSFINTFEGYGDAVQPRVKGASAAAKKGAIGILIRSVTYALDDHPHTGSLRYEDGIEKIPAAALSTLAADRLSQALKSDSNTEIRYILNCKQYDDVKSYNVIGEITGTQYPNEFISVGGHLDAWDNGNGAHDDGAGCVQSMEVLKIFKSLGIKPKHSIRAVMFMNEENGLRGGKKYYEEAIAKQEKHIVAVESDAGGFTPRGFGIDGGKDTIKKIQTYAPLFEPYHIHLLNKGDGGADISYLKKLGTVLIGLRPDSQRYFDYHHTEIDTFDSVNRRELELGAASMAALIYLIDINGL